MNKLIKRLVILLALGLLPLVVYAGNNKGNGSDKVYHPLITHIDGTVKIMGKDHSVWEPAEVGTLLLTGDIVKTGADASAEIMFMSGKIQLYQNSVLIIPSTGVQNRKKDIKEVVVERGSALFDINPIGVKREFEFKTRNVQGGVKGTKFTVSYIENGTSVAVYRGKVVVSDLDRSNETKRILTTGLALRVEDEGPFNKARGFDTDFSIDDYNYKVPPGLDSRGLPADYNANPKNKGVRKRGAGIGDPSSGDPDNGSGTSKDNDLGDNKQ